MFKKIANFCFLALLASQSVYGGMTTSSFCPPDDCAYNAAFGPDIRCSWDLVVSSSFLYWKAEEEGLEPFVIKQKPISSATNTPYETTAFPSLNFPYKPAFKVGLGIEYDCDHWQLLSQYTWYHHDVTLASTSSNDSVTSETVADTAIVPIKLITLGFLANPNSFDSRSINANWKLGLDLIDLELSRHYFVGRCLTLQTHYGLRWGWLKQTYNTNWQAFNKNAQNQLTEQASIATHFHTSSWVIGPRMALDTNWHLANGFRLFGNGATSLLYSYYSIKANQQQKEPDPATSATREETFSIPSTSPCFLRPIGELSLGIAWGDYFDACKWYIDLAVSYDFMIFWNQNMFPFVTDTLATAVPHYPNGDLYLHGLTVALTLSF